MRINVTGFAGYAFSWVDIPLGQALRCGSLSKTGVAPGIVLLVSSYIPLGQALPRGGVSEMGVVPCTVLLVRFCWCGARWFVRAERRFLVWVCWCGSTYLLPRPSRAGASGSSIAVPATCVTYRRKFSNTLRLRPCAHQDHHLASFKHVLLQEFVPYISKGQPVTQTF